jgi:cytochrome P450
MADEDDVLPNGYRVIKGDGMNYMMYAMGRMKYLWGEDAEEFRPERWLANGVFQQESPYKFVAFNVSITCANIRSQVISKSSQERKNHFSFRGL